MSLDISHIPEPEVAKHATTNNATVLLWSRHIWILIGRSWDSKQQSRNAHIKSSFDYIIMHVAQWLRLGLKSSLLSLNHPFHMYGRLPINKRIVLNYDMTLQPNEYENSLMKYSDNCYEEYSPYIPISINYSQMHYINIYELRNPVSVLFNHSQTFR